MEGIISPQLEGVLIGGGVTLVVSVMISIVNGLISSKHQKGRLIFEKNKGIREERIVAYQTYLRGLHGVVTLMETIVDNIDESLPPPEKEIREIYDRFIEEYAVQKILFSDNIEKKIDDFLTKRGKRTEKMSTPEGSLKSIHKTMNDLLDIIGKAMKDDICDYSI